MNKWDDLQRKCSCSRGGAEVLRFGLAQRGIDSVPWGSATMVCATRPIAKSPRLRASA